MRFVDTSFWVALAYRRDAHHSEASSLWTERSGGLITTNHVVGETWTFLRRRTGHVAAVRFIDRAEASRRLGIIHVDASIETEAMAWLRRHDERSYSFVDATSFAVMRQNRLREALAFDGDFSAAGFLELRLSA
ncbi:MAG: type II toxin-antitoxin system VapC family toxin [Chloroflexota bacterium]